MKQKTIGPMKLDCCDDYWVMHGGDFLCDEVLRQHFNIPAAATKLWITLTKRRPTSHNDAICVLPLPPSLYGHPRCALDGNANNPTELTCEAHAASKPFGSTFYATIYYK